MSPELPAKREEEQELRMLRRAWDDGKASGIAGPWDIAEVLGEADRVSSAHDDTRSS